MAISNKADGYRSIKAAAAALGLSELTIRRAIAAGEIPAVQIHGQWRIPPSYFAELELRAYSRCAAGLGLKRAVPLEQGHKRALEWSEPDGQHSLHVVRPRRKSATGRKT